MQKSINAKYPIITVVDARMGRGKSSAAIQYMNDNKGAKRFMYITPYLSEVDRICAACDFDDPKLNYQSKSVELKEKVRRGESFAATHALFHLMDGEAIGLIRQQGYTLIIDENIDVISKVNITPEDLKIVESKFEERNDGTLKWIDQKYTGVFCDYKRAANAGNLIRSGDTLFSILIPSVLKAFDKVIMLTYMFKGQFQRAYLDYFGFKYEIVGVVRDGGAYYISDKADAPSDIDYFSLINIINKKRSDLIGNNRLSMSQNWYAKRGREHTEIVGLRKDMQNHLLKGGKNSRMWTTVISDKDKLLGDKNEYKNDFLQMNARATNNYREKTYLAYMINRFVDPSICAFFESRGVEIDQDIFATAEMLQWIWRSAIREGNSINLFIPSSRMRNLLIGWMETNSGGRLSPIAKKIREGGRRPEIKDVEQYKRAVAEMEEKKRRKTNKR